MKQFFFIFYIFLNVIICKKSELSGDLFGHIMCIVIERIIWSAEHLEYMEYLAAT
jgi:hypothetical protein